MKTKNVLITGCAGYIGSVMSRFFIENGYTVYGVDSLVYGDKGIQEIMNNPKFIFRKADIRELDTYKDVLEQVSGVVHLAAISGMPCCKKHPELAREINYIATTNLYDRCNELQNIERFVFASTTSIFGATENGQIVNEDSEPMPISLYSETKLDCETHFLNKETRADFTTVVFRFPTAFGVSPRMRFDLTINEFVRDVLLGKELEIFGEEFWRPYCHVLDISKGCKMALEKESNLVDKKVLCLGEDKMNLTKRMIYEALFAAFPDGKLTIVPKISDSRDYKVSFSRIKQLDYQIDFDLDKGIEEISSALKAGQFKNPLSDEFTAVFK